MSGRNLFGIGVENPALKKDKPYSVTLATRLGPWIAPEVAREHSKPRKIARVVMHQAVLV